MQTTLWLIKYSAKAGFLEFPYRTLSSEVHKKKPNDDIHGAGGCVGYGKSGKGGVKRGGGVKREQRAWLNWKTGFTVYVHEITTKICEVRENNSPTHASSTTEIKYLNWIQLDESRFPPMGSIPTLQCWLFSILFSKKFRLDCYTMISYYV